MVTTKKKRDYISFSAMKTYQECPYAYKLKYIDDVIKFDANIFSAFGSAIHETLEKKIVDEEIDEETLFVDNFRKQLEEIPKEVRKEKCSTADMILFKEQGVKLVSQYLTEFKRLFKDDYEVISVEERIKEEIPDAELKFLGFIDLVVKNKRTGKYHIIDLKTCGWGWKNEKKSAKLMVYQLIFYKHFFAKKHGIDLDQIEVSFLLLKRTAKKDQLEFVPVTSCNKRTTNALEMLDNTMKLLEKKVFVKNLLFCKNCYNVKECKASRRLCR